MPDLMLFSGAFVPTTLPHIHNYYFTTVPHIFVYVYVCVYFSQCIYTPFVLLNGKQKVGNDASSFVPHLVKQYSKLNNTIYKQVYMYTYYVLRKQYTII